MDKNHIDVICQPNVFMQLPLILFLFPFFAQINQNQPKLITKYDLSSWALCHSIPPPPECNADDILTRSSTLPPSWGCPVPSSRARKECRSLQILAPSLLPSCLCPLRMFPPSP